MFLNDKKKPEDNTSRLHFTFDYINTNASNIDWFRRFSRRCEVLFEL
jgi:hypothetical protein